MISGVLTLGANPEFYKPFDENARRWYRRYAAKALFLNHVLVNPPVDRNKPDNAWNRSGWHRFLQAIHDANGGRMPDTMYWPQVFGATSAPAYWEVSRACWTGEPRSYSSW